jgi:DNA modification methylase
MHAFIAQCGTDKVLPKTKDTFPSIVDNPDRPEHPHSKPVWLLAEHLNHWTPPGIVGDPYAGSGTTLIAAAKTGRICRAMEIAPRYCDVIRRRWTKFAKENKVDPGTGALE